MCAVSGGKVDLTVRIEGRRALSDRFFLLWMEAEELAAEARPGQFVNVLLDKGASAPLLRTPLAVHRVEGNRLWLYFRKVGLSTRALSEKGPGDEIKLLGPLGKGFDIDPAASSEGCKAILVGGGHGAAPLYFLAQKLVETGQDVTVFLGGDREDAVRIAADFEKLDVPVHVSTEDGSRGEKGLVTGQLPRALKSLRGACRVFACGPEAMLKAIREAEDAPARMQFSMDAYMACGIGACGGCAIKLRRGYGLVCKDGPVFNADELEL